MPSHELSPVETRIVGCLIEKERTTPENYPLSLNSLLLACNQSTNREPVVSYDEKTLEEAIWELRQKKLLLQVFAGGARVQKFKHSLLEHYTFNPGDMAVLCVLLLRGPQTPGELRSRTERLHSFASLQELEKCLQELSEGSDPVLRLLPARPGQKERRYVQLLSGEPIEPPPGVELPAAVPRSAQPSRIDQLEIEVAALKELTTKLSEEFAAFRKQFE